MKTIFDLDIRKYEAQFFNKYGSWIVNDFSNFRYIGMPIQYRGYTTTCLEFAYVACKNPDVLVPFVSEKNNYIPEQIKFIDFVFRLKSPNKAKRYGKSKSGGGMIDATPNFPYYQLAAMDNFLRQRWQPGTKYAKALSEKKGAIIEINNWGDNLWGAPTSNWVGRNALGRLLFEINKELQNDELKFGAEEDHWIERQEELVDILNKTEDGGVLYDPEEE